MATVKAPLSAKPGGTTTEFWQTLLTNLLAAGVAFGSLIGNDFDATGLQALVPSLAVLASAAVTAWYAHSRSTVKAAANAALADVVTRRPANVAVSLQAAGERPRGPVATIEI